MTGAAILVVVLFIACFTVGLVMARGGWRR